MLATVVLHNFLMAQRDSGYFYSELVDREVNGELIPGQWRTETTSLASARISRANRSTREAFMYREQLCEYLYLHREEQGLV